MQDLIDEKKAVDEERRAIRVVVIGSSDAGLAAAFRLAKPLRRADIAVTLVDEGDEYFTRGLLRELVTLRRPATEIGIDLNTLLEGSGVELHRAEVIGIKTDERIVATDRGALDYDYLLLAPEAYADFGGVKGAKEHAYTLETMDDAEELREHLIGLFEMASKEKDPEIRKAMLTVVVTGGVAGVEVAIALAEWFDELHLRHWVPKDEIEVVLVESEERIAPEYPRWVSERADSALHVKGVRRLCRSRTRKIGSKVVHLDGGVEIPARTVVWTRGGKANTLMSGLGVFVDRDGFARVDSHLRTGLSGVYAAGASVRVPADDGKGLLAKVRRSAVREGAIAAANIRAEIAGRPSEEYRGRDNHLIYLGEDRPLAVVAGRILPEPIARMVERFRSWVTVCSIGGYRGLRGFSAWLRRDIDIRTSQW